ncbi:MAG: histidinol-phosphatase HisJ [Desulfobacula sp.]|nr:histidinol-phosphatase HisJ [Desulfobacula sp.]
MSTEYISLHGGHSGQYCAHAKDQLEDIIREYIRQEFTCVGITEHAPPESDIFLYPDEIALNLTAKKLYAQFAGYFKELKRLKHKYRGKVKIYAGMETETVTGFEDHTHKLISKFVPDYIVGSVHHVKDICFDYSREKYETACAVCGSIDALYETYFDQQYKMINVLKPFVVGHFDLIRIFDDDYENRLLKANIADKIDRNLNLIKTLNLVMDFNLRPLAKGKKKPYIAASILKRARALNISLVPGDDSHGVNEVGGHVNIAIKILKKYGFETNWPEPKLFSLYIKDKQ